MPTGQIDKRDAPLYLIDLNGDVSDEEYERLLGEILAIYRSPGISAFVWDMTVHQPSSALRRQRQADFIEAHRALIASKSAGVSFVSPEPAMRGALVAVFWRAPPPQPYLIASSLDEARSWARGQLQARGSLPESTSGR